MTAAVDADGLDRRFAAATRIVREAGALARRHFQDVRGLPIRSKGLQDVVSEADVETETLIRARLRESFPQDGFLGEESGAAEADGRATWVVDPIDGTQAYLLGMTSWCVSIAFVLDGVATLGLVFDPMADELFAARRGFGATLNGRPIRPVQEARLSQGMVSVGYPKRMRPRDVMPVLEGLLAAGGMFHRNGSGALSLCYVACGRLLGYVEAHMHPWDCLAAIVVVAESGGRVSDYLTGDALARGNRIVAAAPGVYDELVRLLDLSND